MVSGRATTTTSCKFHDSPTRAGAGLEKLTEQIALCVRARARARVRPSGRFGGKKCGQEMRQEGKRWRCICLVSFFPFLPFFLGGYTSRSPCSSAPRDRAWRVISFANLLLGFERSRARINRENVFNRRSEGSAGASARFFARKKFQNADAR